MCYNPIAWQLAALQLARQELATLVAQIRVQEALRSRTPAAADFIIVPAMKSRVIRENDNKLQGPYTVLRVNRKQVLLNINGKETQFNISNISQLILGQPDGAYTLFCKVLTSVTSYSL